jgi:hypothetical protein
VPEATPGGGTWEAASRPDHNVEPVFVDEQHHERAGGVVVEGEGDGPVGGAVDEAFSERDADVYGWSGRRASHRA